MKATLQIKDLSAALAIVQRCISSKTTLPILTCVHIETGPGSLLLTTSNLDRCVTVRVMAKTTKQGSCVCSMSSLKMAMSSVADEVTLMHDGAMIHTKTNGPLPKTGKYQTLNVEEFPQHLEAGDGCPVNTDDFKAALQRAAAAVTDTTGNMAGVQVEAHERALRFVGISLNSASINLFENIFWNQKNGVMPIEAVNDVLALMPDDSEVKLHIGERFFSFATDTLTYVAKLSDVEFPRWQQIANKPAGLVEFNIQRQQLVTVLDEASELCLRGVLPKVAWIADGKTIKVSTSDNADSVEMEFAQKTEPHDIRFDPSKTLRLIKPWKFDEVRMFVPRDETGTALFIEAHGATMIQGVMRK